MMFASHHSSPRLVTSRDVQFAVAEEDAVLRLLETATVILNSMSIADQPSLHARLRSDIQGLKEFGLESTP